MRALTLLRQNARLKALNIYNWTLPAFAGKLPDGRNYNVCPSAGVCAKACYALNGTYLFPKVRARHEKNLQLILDDPDGWQEAMLSELAHAKFVDTWVRIHDAGDFFSIDYLLRWLHIMRQRPRTRFYAYKPRKSAFSGCTSSRIRHRISGGYTATEEPRTRR